MTIPIPILSPDSITDFQALKLCSKFTIFYGSPSIFFCDRKQENIYILLHTILYYYLRYDPTSCIFLFIEYYRFLVDEVLRGGSNLKKVYPFKIKNVLSKLNVS